MEKQSPQTGGSYFRQADGSLAPVETVETLVEHEPQPDPLIDEKDEDDL